LKKQHERVVKDVFMDKLNEIDYYDIFCDEQVCFFGDSLESYYFDDNHLSLVSVKKFRRLVDNIFLSN